MRIIIGLILICKAISCLAQDGELNDYRRKTENFSRIVDKDIRSDLASFTIGGIEESLGKSPLKKLPVKKYGENYITYDSNDVQVTIKAGIFDPSKHKLTVENKYLVKIDNKPFLGNYGRVPKTTIEGLTIIIGRDTIPIPASAISNLFNPNFTFRDASGVIRSQDGVYLSKDKRKIYIYMLNKDDTGSYEVTWIVQDKKYLRRVVDFGFSK
jgi:hypothetical protein